MQNDNARTLPRSGLDTHDFIRNAKVKLYELQKQEPTLNFMTLHMNSHSLGNITLRIHTERKSSDKETPTIHY